MDDQRRARSQDDTKADPAEGVRIIDADEAAEAIERGEVAPRRSDEELRYGDRPPPPPASGRPALRFPLDANADPTRIERPPVEPAPDPVTGPVEMPHWTDPPTGEVPAVLIGSGEPLLDDDDEELDSWSSFATTSPRWRDADDDWGDDGFVERLAGDSGDVRVGALSDPDAEPSHEEYYGLGDLEERAQERSGRANSVADADQAEPGPRFDLADDNWSASEEGLVDLTASDSDPVQGEPPDARADSGQDEASSADTGPAETEVAESGRDTAVIAPDLEPGEAVPGEVGPDTPIDNGDRDDYDDDSYATEDYEDDGDGYDGYDDEPPMGRNVPQAIGVGVGIGVVGVVCILVGTWAITALVTLILAACAVEYFSVLRKVGWEAATLLGIGIVVATPLAVHWRGPAAFGLVGAISVVATFAWYLSGAGGPDPRVLEGTGATLLGIGWIGGLGAAGTAMVALPDGTALFVTAILATVAYDVAGFFVGRNLGHRPLSAASPNKTVEGLIGGMAAAFVMTVIVVGFVAKGPWTGWSATLTLAIGAAIAAPLGDLCQSLLKRDLGVKDMGTLLPGHGGVLDRFDAMLFVLPAVYWLALFVGHI